MSDLRRAGDDVSVVLSCRWDRLPEEELRARTNDFRARVARPEMTVMVARDQDGYALALLAATIDDSVCAIGFAVATCHEARWALHDHLVRLLIARRVRYLLAADEGPFGALGYPTNVQHYQHLLGYELRHVIPITARPATLRRRLIASLAVVAAAATLVVPPAAAGTARLIPPGPVTETSRSRATMQAAPAKPAAESGSPTASHGLGDAPHHRSNIGQAGANGFDVAGERPAPSGGWRRRG